MHPQASSSSKDTRTSLTPAGGSHSQPNSHVSHTVGTSSSLTSSSSVASSSSHDTHHTCQGAQVHSAVSHAHPMAYIHHLSTSLGPLVACHHLSQDHHPSTITTILDESGNPVGALNVALNLPAVYPSSCESTSSSSCTTSSPPDYQNALPFHIQQVNAAQIYSSPPPTPTLSQLYDTAGPTLASTAALRHYIQPRTNGIALSPHLLSQHQQQHQQAAAVSALSLSPSVLQAALSSLQHSGDPKSLAAVEHQHYHNLLQFPLAAVHLAPDDSNYLQPKSHLASNPSIITTTSLQHPSTSIDGGFAPPPLPHTLSSKGIHIPLSAADTTPLHSTRQSLRGQQHSSSHSSPTLSDPTASATPSTPKGKAPPRKPERPHQNNNNGVKGIFFILSSPQTTLSRTSDLSPRSLTHPNQTSVTMKSLGCFYNSGCRRVYVGLGVSVVRGSLLHTCKVRY